MNSKDSAASNTAVVPVTGYAALRSLDILKDGLGEELQGMSMRLDSIKLPTGASTQFELQGDGDEPIQCKEINCVILHQHAGFGYYKDKYTGGSNPPDCGSFDGITGNGNPGGECRKCPFNQFGSGENGAKACKNRRILYIQKEDELLPLTLSLPTGSLKEFSKYLMHQLTKGRKLNSIVTKISLRRATSSTGIAFSQVVFSFVRVLTPEEQAVINQLSEQMKAYASTLTNAALIPAAGGEVIDTVTGEVQNQAAER